MKTQLRALIRAVAAAGMAWASFGGDLYADSGMIGVGTWDTQAEFADIKVTKGDKIVYAWDPAKGLEGWETYGGEWEVSEGAICQTGEGRGVRALLSEEFEPDYTLTLKARKTGGKEGFLILFNNHVHGMREKNWFNVGGYGNGWHVIENASGPVGGADAGVKGRRLADGVWHDVKIEVKADGVACYLDDELIQTTSE